MSTPIKKRPFIPRGTLDSILQLAKGKYYCNYLSITDKIKSTAIFKKNADKWDPMLINASLDISRSIW